MLGLGYEWGQPFTCESWASDLGLTYPILNDDVDGTDGSGGGGEAWDLFNHGYIPHHVAINHNMEIIYTSAEWEDNGGVIMGVLQDALEECGTLCQSPCSGIPGDIDGTADENNDPIINLMDLLRLADLIESGQDINECIDLTGDVSSDGLVNIIDIYAFATMLVEGSFDN